MLIVGCDFTVAFVTLQEGLVSRWSVHGADVVMSHHMIRVPASSLQRTAVHPPKQYTLYLND